MDKSHHNNPLPVDWQPEDARLLRAARRIIRLYDLLEQEGLFTVKVESLARIMAQELNTAAEVKK